MAEATISFCPRLTDVFGEPWNLEVECRVTVKADNGDLYIKSIDTVEMPGGMNLFHAPARYLKDLGEKIRWQASQCPAFEQNAFDATSHDFEATEDEVGCVTYREAA